MAPGEPYTGGYGFLLLVSISVNGIMNLLNCELERLACLYLPAHYRSVHGDPEPERPAQVSDADHFRDRRREWKDVCIQPGNLEPR